MSKFFGDIRFLLFAHRMLHWENSLSTAPELAWTAKISRINFCINSCNSIPTVNCHIHALNLNIVLFRIFRVYSKKLCIVLLVYWKSKKSCTIHWFSRHNVWCLGGEQNYQVRLALHRRNVAQNRGGCGEEGGGGGGGTGRVHNGVYGCQNVALVATSQRTKEHIIASNRSVQLCNQIILNNALSFYFCDSRNNMEIFFSAFFSSILVVIPSTYWKI